MLLDLHSYLNVSLHSLILHHMGSDKDAALYENTLVVNLIHEVGGCLETGC
jgi:hypothetical protein